MLCMLHESTSSAPCTLQSPHVCMVPRLPVRLRGVQLPCLNRWCLACSICGSDMHPYAGRGVPLDSGITFGHEFTGQVVAAGSEVRGIPLRSCQSHCYCA